MSKPGTMPWMLCMGLISLLLSAHGKPLNTGDKAPHVYGRDPDGKKVRLADFYKSGYTLVYFYPKSDTPGCTAQACNVRDSYESLQKAGVTVIGVSTDSPESQKKFRDKYRLPFLLLADPERDIVNAFGVPTIKLVGLASRQSFLIKDGIIVWRDLDATPKRQAEDVLKA
ncbi:MAG: peroxiredoxin, partial [Verrucomicrobiae bacterium]|nr:peroxiredoxin [Verrucomicrobiae bacterium]